MGLPLLGWLYDTLYALPPLQVLLVAWLITPGMMFIIGLVCEHRILPVNKYQSAAFIPGDLFLGLALMVESILIRFLPDTGWWQLVPYSIVVDVIMLALFLYMRLKGDAPNYADIDGATAYSPTKWYHDFGLYFIYGTILVKPLIPVLFWASGTGTLALKVALVLLVVAYVITDVMDAKECTRINELRTMTEAGAIDDSWRRKEGLMDAAKMHPDDWSDWIPVENSVGRFIIIAFAILICAAIMVGLFAAVLSIPASVANLGFPF